jgi:hypothetical protein
VATAASSGGDGGFERGLRAAAAGASSGGSGGFDRRRLGLAGEMWWGEIDRYDHELIFG